VSGEKQIYRLVHAEARRRAVEAVQRAAEGMVVRISPATRSLEQNALLHAVLTDIAEQVEWHGQKLSLDVWKRLCMAAWMREEKEQPLLVPALDGHGVDIIFERTSKLNVTQCSSLIEWCFAFGGEHGVRFSG
jgi:hypothetical protein